MDTKQIYELWMNKLNDTDPLFRELEAIRGNEEEITDRFYQEIEFGTAGLRGICGAGTNRMNELTVGRATQGIANYILNSGEDRNRGVVIAYDCRYHSKEFSEMAAEIFAGNGIHAYLFPSLRPTPELSFAIRKLRAVSGINLTASHNPKEYNGYKVYWNDGAQIAGDISEGMLAEIQKLSMFDQFKRVSLEEAVKKNLITLLGEDMDRAYLECVKAVSQKPKEMLDLSVSIIYTPLNGAGSIPMQRILEEQEYTNFVIVPEQKDPDTEFTTVPFPNPENPKAFQMAEELGKVRGAEVLIATDPDADRMAIEIADGQGGYMALNGNQTGGLLIAYLAECAKEKGVELQQSAMVKSIVTGDFGRTICEEYGIRVFETLTGFKNICGMIPRLHKLNYSYFFGYEESIGCAPSEEVRDKDGISAGLLIAEMAAYYQKKGMHMAEVLDALYQKYGYFAEEQLSIVLNGKAGQERIRRIMDVFRKESLTQFGTFQVEQRIDYQKGWQDIPLQNALKFVMTDKSWFALRPSGTEPKIKFYFYTVAEERTESKRRIQELAAAVQKLIDGVTG